MDIVSIYDLSDTEVLYVHKSDVHHTKDGDQKSIYSLASEFRIGSFDYDATEEWFNEMLEDFEALRSRFARSGAGDSF